MPILHLREIRYITNSLVTHLVGGHGVNREGLEAGGGEVVNPVVVGEDTRNLGRVVLVRAGRPLEVRRSGSPRGPFGRNPSDRNPSDWHEGIVRTVTSVYHNRISQLFMYSCAMFMTFPVKRWTEDNLQRVLKVLYDKGVPLPIARPPWD